MDYYSGYISKLIEELSILPGIGAKTASRLAFYILDMPQEQVEELSQSIIDAKKNVQYCKKCFTLTDQDICPICASKDRDHKTIMVVENTKDMAAYEKVGEYKGVYHVLHGAINPLMGIGQNDIKLKELFERLKDDIHLFISYSFEDVAISYMEGLSISGKLGGIYYPIQKLIIEKSLMVSHEMKTLFLYLNVNLLIKKEL